jgi:hypothetical protein
MLGRCKPCPSFRFPVHWATATRASTRSQRSSIQFSRGWDSRRAGDADGRGQVIFRRGQVNSTDDGCVGLVDRRWPFPQTGAGPTR